MQINNSQELELAIIELEKRKVVQQSILMSHFHETYESLKPVNLLKAAFHKVTEPGGTRATLLKAAGGIGVGLLTKNLLIGKSTSAVGSLVRNAIRLTASNTVYNNADKIKAYGTAIFNNLFKKHK
ncbi:MAG: hypothetical protein ABJA37_01435 [Ferruginibacter sp.]